MVLLLSINVNFLTGETMNKSHLAHAIIALFFQGVIWVLTGSLWGGAAWSIAWFISREHMDQQRKIVAQSKREGDPTTVEDLWPWAGLDVWNWSRDAQFDALVPSVVVLAVAFGLR